MLPRYLSIGNKNTLHVILLDGCNNFAFFQIYYPVMLLYCFVAILEKLDILTLSQSYNNDSKTLTIAEIRNRFAIFQYFKEIILQYIYNLFVRY